MELYKVVKGVARFGPGQSIALSASQIASREPALEKEKKRKKFGDLFLAKASAAIEFKTGEIVGLPEVTKNLLGTLTPLAEIESKPTRDADPDPEKLV